MLGIVNDPRGLQNLEPQDFSVETKIRNDAGPDFVTVADLIGLQGNYH